MFIAPALISTSSVRSGTFYISLLTELVEIDKHNGYKHRASDGALNTPCFMWLRIISQASHF